MREIKERPIIFNTEMIQAILDDRKSQTRRVIKPQPQYTIEPYSADKRGINTWRERIVNKYIECSYGKIGDGLWIRETFYQGKVTEEDSTDGYPGGCYVSQCFGEDDIIPKEYCIRYGITTEDVKLKPSIFMPRIASRITLEITDIWPERLQDIKYEDCMKEGIRYNGAGQYFWNKKEYSCFTAIEAFQKLWDSINAKRGYSLESNPWVFVISFKRL